MEWITSLFSLPSSPSTPTCIPMSIGSSPPPNEIQLWHYLWGRVWGYYSMNAPMRIDDDLCATDESIEFHLSQVVHIESVSYHWIRLWEYYNMEPPEDVATETSCKTEICIAPPACFGTLPTYVDMSNMPFAWCWGWLEESGTWLVNTQDELEWVIHVLPHPFIDQWIQHTFQMFRISAHVTRHRTCHRWYLSQTCANHWLWQLAQHLEPLIKQISPLYQKWKRMRCVTLGDENRPHDLNK